MDGKLLVALAGIIISAMSVELNDAVSSALLSDIGGGLGFGHDAGTWFGSLYLSAEIFGMAVSPWFLVTFSLRRWALFVIGLTAVATMLIPFTSNLALLFGLRSVQGLCEGLTIPLLMTTALRALGPAIRLYGLAAYSLSATVFPSAATALAAFWMQTGDGVLGWHFAFWEAGPIAAFAASLVWWGMPQDPPDYGRFRNCDWPGALLVLIGFGALSTMLQQGDRLDWFNSPMISVLALVSVVAIPLLLVNEWRQDTPLLKLQMLLRPNLAFGLIALFSFVIISLAGSTVPNDYLREVQGFRPAQSYLVTAEIAASQLVLLPLMAVVLDRAFVDARVVNFLGLGCIVGACVGSSLLTDVWRDGEFFLWQGLISVGEAMVVMSLLLLSTNSVSPQEGPFASALVNTPRAIGEATGVWMLQLVQRWRGGLHSVRLTDQIGQARYRVVQGAPVLPQDPGPLLAGGQPRAPGALAGFDAVVRQQVTVLTLSDAFLILGALAAALMLLVLVLPVRTMPPRIQLAKH